MPTGIGSGIAGEVFTDEIGSGSRGGSTICPTRYSVEFDGSTTYGLEQDTKIDLGTDNFSFSFWFKTIGGGTKQGFHTTDFTSSANGLDIYLSAAGQLTADFDTIAFVGGTVPSDNEWHHAVLSVDRLGDWKWYLDGVNINTVDHSAVTAPIENGAQVRWAKTTTTPSGDTFDGNLTELSIWGTALSSSEVLTIYNNMFGSQTCLTDLTFGSGNLIQNGSFNQIGPQLIDNPTFNAPTSPDLIVNGDFSAEGINLVDNPNFSDTGVEKVVNGDFVSNITGWSLTSGDSTSSMAWSAGALNLAVTVAGTITNRPRLKGTESVLVVGKSYKVSLDVVVNSGTCIWQTIDIDGTNPPISKTLTTGVHTIYVTAASANTNVYLYFNGTNLFNIDINSVSVKELGADWTGFGSDPDSVSFGENGLTIVQSSDLDDNNRAYQSDVTSDDKSYKVTYTIFDSSYTSFNRVQYWNGSTYINLPEQGVGTHTFYYTRKGTSDTWLFNLYTSTDAPTDFVTISNLTVQELGEGWTIESGWSIGDDIANANVVGTNALYQSGIELNKNYKVTYTISNFVSGDIRVRVGTSSTPTVRSSDGTFTEYLFATGTNQIRISPFTSGFVGSITNITVQEVDWNFGGGWSLGSNKALATAAVGGDTLSQTGVFTLDKSYKTTFLSTLDSGSCFAEFGSDGFIGQLPSGTASNLFYYQTNEVGDSARIAFEAQSLMTGSISNVLTYQMDPNGYWNIPTANSTQLVLNPTFTNTGPEEVTNGDFSQTALGSEEIVDGSFPNGSTAWSEIDGGTIVDNQMVLDCGNATNAYTFQSNSTAYTLGKTYQVTVTIASNTTGVSLILYPFSASPYTSVITVGETAGTYTVSFVPDYTSGSGKTFALRALSSTGVLVIDSVSVKEVLQLVTNGDFTEGTEGVAGGNFESGLIGTVANSGGTVYTWALNTVAPISGTQDGLLSITSVGTNVSHPRLQFDGTLALDESFVLTFDYKVNSGTCEFSSIRTGGVSSVNFPTVTLTGSGTYTFYFQGAGTGLLTINFDGTNLFDTQFDNISIKELGSDWIQSGAPDDPGTFGENGLTITSVNGDGNVNRVRQSSVTAASKSYKVTYTIHSATLTGTNKFRYWAGTIYADLPTAITGTPQTFYYTTPPTTVNFDWYFKVETFNGSTTDNVTISSISVQELGEGWFIGDKWSLSDAGARLVSSTSAASSLVQSNVFEIGKSYKVTLDAVVNSGKAKLEGSGGSTQIEIDETKTYVEYFVASITDFYLNRLTSISDIYINNISVKETGLDWISPDAGIVNTFSATGLTMTSVNGAGYNNRIRQDNVTADDQAYKVDYTIVGSSLTAGNYLQFYNGATYVNMKTSVGSHILHFTRSGADDSVYLRLASNDGSTTDTVDIGSITIVEVQGWTLEDGKLVGDLPDLAKSATQGIGAIAGNSYKATMDVALAEEELITNGSFREVGADLVLAGDFPLPNVYWLKAASTTINGGSATFGGLGTVADMLAGAFALRVEADGGVVEAQSCLISDLTFLTENP